MARSVQTGECNDRGEWINASWDSRGRISGDDVPLTTTLSVANGDERANTLITWFFEDDLTGRYARTDIEPRSWFCGSRKDKNLLLAVGATERVAKTECSFRC